MASGTVIINDYDETDRLALTRLMEELQDIVAGIDPLKHLRRLPPYGRTYTNRLLKTVGKQDGKIYIARQGGRVCGCIVGIVEKQKPKDLLGSVPSTHGRIVELIVSDDQRGRGIGDKLIKKMERYFVSNGCDVIFVEVFAPNSLARRFYAGEGYFERDIMLAKQLRGSEKRETA